MLLFPQLHTAKIQYTSVRPKILMFFRHFFQKMMQKGNDAREGLAIFDFLNFDFKISGAESRESVGRYQLTLNPSSCSFLAVGKNFGWKSFWIPIRMFPPFLGSLNPVDISDLRNAVLMSGPKHAT